MCSVREPSAARGTGRQGGSDDRATQVGGPGQSCGRPLNQEPADEEQLPCKNFMYTMLGPPCKLGIRGAPGLGLRDVAPARPVLERN